MGYEMCGISVMMGGLGLLWRYVYTGRNLCVGGGMRFVGLFFIKDVEGNVRVLKPVGGWVCMAFFFFCFFFLGVCKPVHYLYTRWLVTRLAFVSFIHYKLCSLVL